MNQQEHPVHRQNTAGRVTPAVEQGISPQAPDPFADYYARESLSDATLARFRSTMDAVMRVRRRFGLPCERLAVGDIGCGAATQCMIWAAEGHRVAGIDINARLVQLGRERSTAAGLDLELEVGSAVALPWESSSLDVCLLPEVLEHVEDWRACVAEAVRVLGPSGLLYLSTTNRLCPIQQEFALPLYSWYPPPLKRRYERLARTSRPELVNHAEFPAVHWFDFYTLRRTPELTGFRCLDRFEVAALAHHSLPARLVLSAVNHLPPLRLLAHIATPYTAIFAVKGDAAVQSAFPATPAD